MPDTGRQSLSFSQPSRLDYFERIAKIAADREDRQDTRSTREVHALNELRQKNTQELVEAKLLSNIFGNDTATDPVVTALVKSNAAADTIILEAMRQSVEKSKKSSP